MMTSNREKSIIITSRRALGGPPVDDDAMPSTEKRQRTLRETMARAENARDVRTALRFDDDAGDDGFEIVTTPNATTTTTTRTFERRRARVETFDDFTVAYVSNEAHESSLTETTTNMSHHHRNRPRRRRDVDEERTSDEAFARAISNELRVGLEAGKRSLRPEMYERLVRTCLRRRGARASARDAAAARRAVGILRACEARTPATALVRRADDGVTRRKSCGAVVDVTGAPPIVVTTAEAWTPLENAERSRDGARRGGGELDWFQFDELLDRSTHGDAPPTTSTTTTSMMTTPGRGSGGAVRRSARDRGGRVTGDETSDDDAESDDDDDDDDDDEDENDRKDPAYEHVGAKLLFIHSCAVFARDARLRLHALAKWRAAGGADAKRATSLAQNAMLYRFVVDIAPTDGHRNTFFIKMIELACLAAERLGAQRDGDADASTTSAEYYDAGVGSASTKTRPRSSVGSTVARSAAFAPTVAGAEDCGVLEVSSAARDVLEAIVALLDACEDVEGASRRHSKIRVQIEDAYAEAWKHTGAARLRRDESKRVFLREIRDPRLRLVRAREILARRVDRRHAPGILAGGDGGDGARGAVDVFDYVAGDAVRAVKAQQQSEGSGDYAAAASALGAVASAAAYGVACARTRDDGVAASLRACVDAYVAETHRKDVCDPAAVASLACAVAFVE